MTQEKPVILIYNPISGHGHLDSWNAMFVKLLIETGWRVLSLTPDAAALLSRLPSKGAEFNDQLQILDWSSNQPDGRDTIELLKRKARYLGDRYLYRRPGSEVTPEMPFLRALKKRALQGTVPLLIHLSYSVYRILGGQKSFESLWPDNQQELHLMCPVETALRIKRALKRAKWKPLITFNMYLDGYQTGKEKWEAFDSTNRIPWSGIRFVPRSSPNEAWYSLPSCKGVCFLEESVVESYQTALPTKHFQYLPDITEVSVPQSQSEMVREIKRRARNRKIVFLGGSIGGQKNLARWFELISSANAEDWFFVQVGEVHKDTLTEEDLVWFEKVRTSPPENLLLHTQYLADEKAFNEVIAACDVIFAVYRNFPYSSNMPGKAAHFQKPILVSNRYLMGERVLKYRIGLAVDENELLIAFKT
ncbi:hypothetical protein EBT16_10915 [bacterium]|nr:hypothetical protein [bacterium]